MRYALVGLLTFLLGSLGTWWFAKAEAVPAPRPAEPPPPTPAAALVQKKVRLMPLAFEVGDAVRAGDHVDVVVAADGPSEAWSTTLVQNVITRRVDAAGGLRRIVWLLVLPEEAELLAVAERKAHLSLTLRNADDVDVLEARPATVLTPPPTPKSICRYTVGEIRSMQAKP
jgi:hypothetical protein